MEFFDKLIRVNREQPIVIVLELIIIARIAFLANQVIREWSNTRKAKEWADAFLDPDDD